MFKVFRPQGQDLINCLNDGCIICNECGACMYSEANPDSPGYLYICPGCGLKVDTIDYEYTGQYALTGTIPGLPPEGCRACGGPYPDCTSSCPLFDD